MHLLWSASFPTVPLSAVYHLLCAAASLAGVACVFSLLHMAYTVWAWTITVGTHNVEPLVQGTSAEVRHCKLHSFPHRRQPEYVRAKIFLHALLFFLWDDSRSVPLMVDCAPISHARMALATFGGFATCVILKGGWACREAEPIMCL